MKVILKGKNLETTLDKRYFLAKGGEGSIYVKGSTTYKICEPGKCIPEDKIRELSVLTEPHIVRPEDLLLDEKGKECGYTLKFIPDAFTLCQIFTKAFRNRYNVKPDQVLALVKQMQETTRFIHKNKILLVDYNELNFLVDQTLKNVYFIDVNSYQTPHYPATAIMESIRDRHCKGKWSESTDWFSFAIVAFQMFIGIHPYKGSHPRFHDPKTALDGRMKENISVFNPEVSYPKAVCQPLSVIPPAYLKWFEAVLEHGKRVPPPFDGEEIIKVMAQIKKIAGSNNFEIKELRKCAADIIRYYYNMGKEVILTDSGALVDGRMVVLDEPNCAIAFTNRQVPVAAWIKNKTLHLTNLLTNDPVTYTGNAQALMEYDGRLYVQNGDKVLELIFTEQPNKVITSSYPVGSCSDTAAKFFDGVMIQNLFDAHYCSVFPKSRQCRQFKLPELDRYKVIDAKFDTSVMVVIGADAKGLYDRMVFRFAPDWSGYDVRIIRDVQHTGINFTVLETGTCVLMSEDEKIEIFRAERGNPAVKIIDDPALEGDMILDKQGKVAVFTKGDKLFSIAVRK